MIEGWPDFITDSASSLADKVSDKVNDTMSKVNSVVDKVNDVVDEIGKVVDSIPVVSDIDVNLSTLTNLTDVDKTFGTITSVMDLPYLPKIPQIPLLDKVFDLVTSTCPPLCFPNMPEIPDVKTQLKKIDEIIKIYDALKSFDTNTLVTKGERITSTIDIANQYLAQTKIFESIINKFDSFTTLSTSTLDKCLNMLKIIQTNIVQINGKILNIQTLVDNESSKPKLLESKINSLQFDKTISLLDTLTTRLNNVSTTTTTIQSNVGTLKKLSDSIDLDNVNKVVKNVVGLNNIISIINNFHTTVSKINFENLIKRFSDFDSKDFNIDGKIEEVSKNVSKILALRDNLEMIDTQVFKKLPDIFANLKDVSSSSVSYVDMLKNYMENLGKIKNSLEILKEFTRLQGLSTTMIDMAKNLSDLATKAELLDDVKKIPSMITNVIDKIKKVADTIPNDEWFKNAMDGVTNIGGDILGDLSVSSELEKFIDTNGKYFIYIIVGLLVFPIILKVALN